MLFLRLLLVAFLTLCGQGVALIVGRWLITNGGTGLGSDFVQLNATFQVAVLSFSGMAAPALMHQALGIRDAGVPERLSGMRDGLILVCLLGAIGGAVYLLANGIHPLLGVTLLPAAILGVSCEPIHYGTGHAIRAAVWSAAKAVFVPIAFLLATLFGLGVFGVFATMVLFAILAYFMIRWDAIQTLGKQVPISGIWTRLRHGLKTCATGIGAALNGLQRVLPLLIVAPLLEAKSLADMFMFYSAYNLGYGGLRLISQALFRHFSRGSLAAFLFWLSMIFGASFFLARAAFGVMFPEGVSALVFVGVPAIAFVGYHIKVTHRGDFLRYGWVNAIALAGLLVLCLLIRSRLADARALYAGAAAIEWLCGISYWYLDRWQIPK